MQSDTLSLSDGAEWLENCVVLGLLHVFLGSKFKCDMRFQSNVLYRGTCLCKSRLFQQRVQKTEPDPCPVATGICGAGKCHHFINGFIHMPFPPLRIVFQVSNILHEIFCGQVAYQQSSVPVTVFLESSHGEAARIFWCRDAPEMKTSAFYFMALREMGGWPCPELLEIIAQLGHLFASKSAAKVYCENIFQPCCLWMGSWIRWPFGSFQVCESPSDIQL